MRTNQRNANSGRATVLALAACATIGLSAATGLAATAQWNALPVDGNWLNNSNWSAGAPGNNSAGATATNDVAQFGSSSITSISVDANRTLSTLDFLNTSSNYTFNGPGTLYLRHSAGFGGNAAIQGANASTITFNTPVVFTAGDYRVVLKTGQTVNFKSTVTSPSGQTMWMWGGTGGTINFDAPFNSAGTNAANARFVSTTPGTINFNVSSTVGKSVALSADAGSPGIFNLGASGITNNGGISLATGTLNVNTANAISGTSTVAVGSGYSASVTATGNIKYGNTYSGATTIGNTTVGMTPSRALFLITNPSGTSATGTSDITVKIGTLAGTGFIDNTGGAKGVTLNAGAVLSPGASAGAIGTLTIAAGTKGLDLSGAAGVAGSAAFKFDLSTLASHDLVNLTAGQLVIGSAGLEFDDFMFNFTGTPGTLPTGTYTLFQTTQSISGTLGSSLSGSVDGKSATIGFDGTGQNVILSVVPEPAGLGALGLGALAMFGRRRH